MGLTGYQKARRRISEPAPVVKVEALAALSWSPDGIAVEDCDAGDVVEIPAQIADAYIEQGFAVAVEDEDEDDADEPAEAEQPQEEPEPEEAPTPTEEPAAPQGDAQGNEDEDSADGDEQGSEEPAAEPEATPEPEPVDEAQVQADALAALIARGKDELHKAAKAHEVKVHPNAGAEKVARALLEAGVTLAGD